MFKLFLHKGGWHAPGSLLVNYIFLSDSKKIRTILYGFLSDIIPSRIQLLLETTFKARYFE
jgi:hypothetical protein